MIGDELSPHPADRLIRALIDTERSVSTDEIEQIVDRMATTPFGLGMTTVPGRYRGLIYQGRMLSHRADPLFVHLVERVVVDRQWASGTTAAEYLQHLRAAVRAPGGRLVVYRRRGGSVAAVIQRTEEIVPRDKLDVGSLPLIVVVYSADRGILVSGYQFSSMSTIRIPEGARWLT